MIEWNPATAARPVRALIFDLDGTLADTIGGIQDGMNETMRHYGYPEKSYEDVRRAIGNGARLLVKRCMPADAAEDDGFARTFSLEVEELSCTMA